MTTSIRIPRLYLSVVALLLAGSVVRAEDSQSAKPDPQEKQRAIIDSKIAQLRQLEQQSKALDARTAEGAESTDKQLAEKILQEETLLAARRELMSAAAQVETRSPDEVIADNQMAVELREAGSSEERDAIISKYRAYRRVTGRDAAKISTEAKK